MKSPKSGYIPTLDGWRALSILLVMAGHVIQASNLPGRWQPFSFLLGQRGVSCFFAISGLLISWRLLEERGLLGHISLRDFYIRRFFRILPAAFFYLLAVGALGAVHVIDLHKIEWFSALFFFANYVNTGWWVGHFWSLAVEEHFYLFWPALLVFLGPNRSGRVLIGISILVALWRWWIWMHRPAHFFNFYYRTDTQVDRILYGCLVALLLQSKEIRTWIAERVSVIWWFVLAALFLAAAAATARPLTLPALDPRPWYPACWMIQAITMPMIIAGTVLHPESPLGRLLERRLMRWIGRLSYSLYLWQQLFIGLCRTHHTFIPLAVVAAFGAAAFSFYFIERPLIRMGHRLAPPVTPGRTELEPQVTG